MNTTESLKDHETSILHKLIKTSYEEEVVEENILAFMEFLSCSIKVKVDIQVLQELSDGVTVSVRLLKYNNYL
jgi:hypothetical protein